MILKKKRERQKEIQFNLGKFEHTSFQPFVESNRIAEKCIKQD
jgi:hypothetical protein